MSLDLSVTLTRERLGLADLELNDEANGYRVFAFDPGQRNLELLTGSSPVSDGNCLRSFKASQQIAIINVRVSGTAAEISARIRALERAANQFSYICTMKSGATTLERFRCQPANSTRGGNTRGYDPELFNAGRVDVVLEIPRMPDGYTS